MHNVSRFDQEPKGVVLKTFNSNSLRVKLHFSNTPPAQRNIRIDNGELLVKKKFVVPTRTQKLHEI